MARRLKKVKRVDAELDCFRLAAELGCPDFKIDGGEVWFEQDYCEDGIIQGVRYLIPIMDCPRINRQASAVCADWWNTSGRNRAHTLTIDSYVEQARAFGRKYGGDQ